MMANKSKITVNKIFYDRRANRPTWLCHILGGVGPNAENICGSGYGCCRAVAYIRALRQFRLIERATTKGK